MISLVLRSWRQLSEATAQFGRRTHLTQNPGGHVIYYTQHFESKTSHLAEVATGREDGRSGGARFVFRMGESMMCIKVS